MQLDSLLGRWHCSYWYPSNTSTGEDVSEYDMKSYIDGDVLVLESEPNEEESYMLVRLHVEDGIAVGNWHETASPHKEFKGAQYSGAGQLTIDPATRVLEGKWAGAGYDHKLEQMRIYSGNWQLTPLAD